MGLYAAEAQPTKNIEFGCMQYHHKSDFMSLSLHLTSRSHRQSTLLILGRVSFVAIQFYSWRIVSF